MPSVKGAQFFFPPLPTDRHLNCASLTGRPFDSLRPLSLFGHCRKAQNPFGNSFPLLGFSTVPLGFRQEILPSYLLSFQTVKAYPIRKKSGGTYGSKPLSFQGSQTRANMRKAALPTTSNSLCPKMPLMNYYGSFIKHPTAMTAKSSLPSKRSGFRAKTCPIADVPLIFRPRCSHPLV